MHTTGPYLLVIVRRDRRDLYSKLRQSFEGTPFVEVTLDRRQEERRRDGGRVQGDRRRTVRRRPAMLGDQARTDGYRCVQKGNGFEFFQAEGRVTIKCPKCSMLLEFDMPRFGELPARLDIDLIHDQSPTRGLQHFVEAQAFRTSGRSLLACRMQARRQFASS